MSDESGCRLVHLGREVHVRNFKKRVVTLALKANE